MSDRLDVWLYGTRLAEVARDARERLHLSWTDDGLARWPRGSRILSAKLASGAMLSPVIVKNYLDGLLPEGNARVNHAMNAGVRPDDTFGLVAAYGQDTPGAAVFVQAGAPDPTRVGSYEPVSDEELFRRLAQADRHSPTQRSLGESSTLPGMVPKIVAHRERDQWFACVDGAPSTWIVKQGPPADSEVADLIDTEVACLALARQMGLTSIEAEVVELDGARGIAVSRYDRPGGSERLHQEDLAQAIGLNTLDPNRKFQWGSRMPSLVDAASVLRLDGGNPDALLRLTTFTHLVGNTDMHAKNISFLRRSDGSVALSPAYDIAMHLHHPRQDRRFALDVNGKFWAEQIAAEDLVAEGMSWGLPPRRATRVVTETVDALSAALQAIDRGHHTGVDERAWSVVEDRVVRAERELASGR